MCCIHIQEDGIAFIPCVPDYLKNSAIENLVIRGKRFTLRLQGSGSKVSSVTVNGQPRERAWVAFEEAAEQNEIILAL